MQREIPEREKNTAYTPHIQEKDMNMRKIMAGLAVTTLVLGSASLALARGHHGGHYGGMMNLLHRRIPESDAGEAGGGGQADSGTRGRDEPPA